MTITRTSDEVEFLKRVDAAWRRGATQDVIATAEGLSGASAIRGKVSRLGFLLERTGGLRVVDLLYGRDLTDLLDSGELIADPEPAPAEAVR